jgi:hypothetical protein
MTTLTYEQAREVIQDGDVVFFEGSWHAITNAAIMYFTRSRFYHVGVAFWVGSGDNKRCLIVEAHGLSRRRIVMLNYYANYKMVVVPSTIPWNIAQDEAFKRLGKERYGKLEALYIGIREYLLKYHNVNIPARNFGGEVCSEFVAKVCQFSDTNISPQMLYELLTLDRKEKGA